jgi:hypothetical protein
LKRYNLIINTIVHPTGLGDTYDQRIDPIEHPDGEWVRFDDAYEHFAHLSGALTVAQDQLASYQQRFMRLLKENANDGTDCDD